MVTGRGLDAGTGARAYDVTEIGRERLDHSASDRIEDLLRDVPGFQQFRRSDARTATAGWLANAERLLIGPVLNSVAKV